MTIKTWLARKLDPATAREAERYRFMEMNVSLAHRWLGQFPVAEALTEWLIQRDYDHFRALTDPASDAKWNWDISGFREQLRALTKASSP